MTTEEDWLFRPVFYNMYPATALRDGSIDLLFVLVCNDAIDTKEENDRRSDEAAQDEFNRR